MIPASPHSIRLLRLRHSLSLSSSLSPLSLTLYLYVSCFFVRVFVLASTEPPATSVPAAAAPRLPGSEVLDRARAPYCRLTVANKQVQAALLRCTQKRGGPWRRRRDFSDSRS